MRLFEMREIKESLEYAESGGQALHLMSHSGGTYPNAPDCFRRTSEFAHLIDMDKERLIATAKRLGVRVIKVSREGHEGQHIDLCGKPLAKAKAMCQ